MSMFYELMMRKKTEIMYATIKGSLTENDGVFSGFSPANYLSLDCGTNTINKWEVSIDFSYTNSVTQNYNGLFSQYSPSFQIYIKKGENKLKVEINTTTNLVIIDLIEGSSYNINIKYSAGNWIVILTNKGTGNKVTRTSTTSDTWYLSGIFRFGTTQSGSYGWDNTINLNTSYLKIGATKYKLQAVVGYTVVGSPTIVDGVVSGLTQSNYIKLSDKIQNIADWQNLHIHTEFEVSSLPSAAVVFCIGAYNIKFNIRLGNYLYFQYRALSSPNALQTASTNTSVIPLNSVITVDLNCIKDTSAHLVVKSGTNILWDFFANDFTINGNNNFLIGTDISYFGGDNLFVNLNNTYIKINNKLWFNGQQSA